MVGFYSPIEIFGITRFLLGLDRRFFIFYMPHTTEVGVGLVVLGSMLLVSAAQNRSVANIHKTTQE